MQFQILIQIVYFVLKYCSDLDSISRFRFHNEIQVQIQMKFQIQIQNQIKFQILM